jgi:4-amino-4-deoxy-L-arabinose transferase-like glycosyltransferase
MPPYVYTIENKTPGIFFVFAIADKFGLYSVIFVRILGILFSIGSLAIVYSISRKLFQKEIALISLYIYGFVSCWYVMDGNFLSQTEIFMVFFSLLAFYILVTYQQKENQLLYLFIAGLSLGMAINFKQIAITTLMGFLIVLFWYTNGIKKYVKGIILVVFGVTLAVAAAYLFLLFNDGVSFYDYMNQAWFILFNSGSKIDSIEKHLVNFFRVFFISKLVFFIPIVGIFFFKIKQLIVLRPVLMLMSLWFVFDFIGANASGYYFGHQLRQLLPSLSIVIAIVIYHYAIKMNTRNKLYRIALALLFLVLFPIKRVGYAFYCTIYPPFKAEQNTIVKNVLSYLDQNANKRDYIYLLGGDSDLVLVLGQAKLMSASKYFHSIFITSEKERSHVNRDLRKNQPKYILVHKFFTGIEDIYGSATYSFFKSNYYLAETLDNVLLYKKK